jgi:hypothetical protein
MSADNWTICPKCKKNVRETEESRSEKVANAYGKIDASEWLKLVETAGIELPVECSFREDYEIGIESEGGFYINYSGRCRVCNFSYKFTHTSENILD